MAVIRTVYSETARQMLAGEKAVDVVSDHIAAVEQAFDTLAGGVR